MCLAHMKAYVTFCSPNAWSIRTGFSQVQMALLSFCAIMVQYEENRKALCISKYLNG